MENNVNRVPVGWRIAAKEQFRIIGPRHQRELLVFMGIGTLLALFGTINVSMRVSVGGESILAFPRLMVVYPFLLAFAVIWPLSVWGDKGSSWRAYHQAMPIDRRVHDLARILMGGAWMFMAIALMVLLGSGFILRSDTSGMISDLAPWFWIAFFTGPATVYLGSSIVALASKHPLAWIVGIPFGALGLVLAVRPLGSLGQILSGLVTGPIGLGFALTRPVLPASRSSEQVPASGGSLPHWDGSPWQESEYSTQQAGRSRNRGTGACPLLVLA